jgi:hypothetical protein
MLPSLKSFEIYYALIYGEMSEWFKEHAWKACVLERVPRVRIPLSPPYFEPIAAALRLY